MGDLTSKYAAMMALSDDEANDIRDDNTTLDFTQKVRRVMVRELTKDGLPSDNETLSMTLNALNSMDRTALSRMKLGVEQSAVENDKQIIEMATRLRDYELKPSQPGTARDDAPDADVIDLPPSEFNVGEDHIGLVTESAKEFMERFENNNPVAYKET